MPIVPVLESFRDVALPAFFIILIFCYSGCAPKSDDEILKPTETHSSPQVGEQKEQVPPEVMEFYSKWIGVPAPELGPDAVDRTEGPPILLKDHSGKRILLFGFYSGNFVNAPNEEELLKTLKDLDEVRQELGVDGAVVIGFTQGTDFTWPGVETPEPFKSLSDFPIINTTNREFNEPYNILSGPSGIAIDKHGIITKIHLDAMSKEEIRVALSGPDWDEPIRPIPIEDPWEGGEPPIPSMKPVTAWSKEIPPLLGMCPGDWNLDGTPDLIGVTNDQEALVISSTGEVMERFPFKEASPDTPVYIQWGVFGDRESGLIHVADGWPEDVPVIGAKGVLWRYPTSDRMGVDSGCLTDIDGDGLSELLMGFNGPGTMGGFHLVSSTGEAIWKQTSVGNVWTVAGIAAKEGRPGLAICTDGGGAIEIFDAGGNHVRSLNNKGRFTSEFHAAEMNPSGFRQILTVRAAPAGNLDYAVATDFEGNSLWKYPVDADAVSNAPWSILTADVTGDGTDEWIIYPQRGELVALDVHGSLIARYERPVSGWRSWGVLPRRSQPALVVFSGQQELVAYTLVDPNHGER